MPSTCWCAYSYSYTIEARFCPAVDYHFFRLRVMPAHTACQQVLEQHVTLAPACCWSESVDAQGNRVQYGGFDSEHSYFRVESRGVVRCSPYCIPEARPNQVYRYPSPLVPLLPCPATTVLDVMHWAHAQLAYTPGVTDNATTAADALRLRQGVCQDYAHLMIACCRRLGLLARYACGLIPGEGATHAWVEVHDGHAWLGYDPTHDCPIATGYIKLAHGRDASDCPLNRGRIYGWTTETLTITCNVTLAPDPQ